MLDRHKVRQLEERCHEEIIAKGKARFVYLKSVSVLFCFAVLLTALYFSNGRTSSSLFASLVVFPIGALGGYWHAIWKWQDITRHRS